MSLLLDALKKAAEQKAQISKQAQQPETPAGEDARPAPAQSRDDTRLDDSDFDGRTDPTLARRDPADATGLEFDDPSRQMRTGEDETIFFADEETSEFAAGPRADPRSPEDETDLGESEWRDEDTLLRARPPGDDATGAQASPADETNLSQVDGRDPGETRPAPAPLDEETDLSLLFGDDPTGDAAPARPAEETDISIPPQPTSEIDHGAAAPSASDEDSDMTRLEADIFGAGTGEDLSLLLDDREDTGVTGTSVTDPQPPASFGALEDGGELALVDLTQHRAPADGTVTEQSATATTRAADTLTGGGTTVRAEPTTSRTAGATTRTYAPDNYDRTLMKLPSDDASRLFAGMQADSDVVMTPEYAKKVFQSKSSAQRLQYYKLYAGISLAILLGIGVYGLFEMQSESSRIETSLYPLKRDPMPGAIEPAKQQPTGLALPLAEVDEKTIRLIENAGPESGGNAADDGPVAKPAQALAADGAAAVTQSPASATTQAVLTGDIGADSRPAGSTASAPRSASSGLEIRSSSRIEDKDRWLREAYAAYLAGDDAVALERYNRVLEVEPQNRNALLARAAISVQNGDTGTAIADYQALLLTNPKDSLAMSSLLTVANYSPEETETQIKIMLRDEPESPYLNFALANAFGAQNRWQEAQAHYFTALQNNPDDPNYAYNLAVSLEHIAKPEVAIAYYQRALENFDKGLATFSREVVGQRLETLRKL